MSIFQCRTLTTSLRVTSEQGPGTLTSAANDARVKNGRAIASRFANPGAVPAEPDKAQVGHPKHPSKLAGADVCGRRSSVCGGKRHLYVNPV